jgi:hypothetical protein
MNTPAHVVVSAVLLGRGAGRALAGPLVLGALLPDLPMLVFYGVQKLALRAPEQKIWSAAYFDPGWQQFFDLFNSLPLIALGAFVAFRTEATPALAVLASMAVHCLCDLPLHREDAHGHLFPLTDWRFRSPISYWAPAHHGRAFASAELALALVGGAVLLRRPERSWRIVGGAVLALYAAFLAFALSCWGNGGLG